MEPPPRKPNESECCGSGCKRCIFDLYEEEYKIWERKKRACLGYKPKITLSPNEYTKVVIKVAKKLTADTNFYVLLSPDSLNIASMGIGQHIVVKVERDGKSIARQYTPIEAAGEDLHLLIKIYHDAPMSSAVSEWKMGDTVLLRGPLGTTVDYFTNKWEAVLVVAAGTGITPMVRLIKEILANDDEETMLLVLYACKKYDDILLKHMFDEWRDHWNFKVFYFLSRERYDDVRTKKKYAENVKCGRVTLQSIKDLITVENLNPKQVFSLVCGPTSFETSVEQDLLACEVLRENIRRF